MTASVSSSLAAFTLFTMLLVPFASFAEDEPQAFYSRNVLELGVVVADLDASATFYTEVLGMTEIKGFAAPAQVATKFGLTNNQPIVVRKFVTADVKDAPALKLMEFPEAPGAKPDQKYIHSTLGVSYLTLFVNDMDDAVARAKKAGVKMLGETPAKAGPKNYLTVFQDPDDNFIELIGPSKVNLEKPKEKKAGDGGLSFHDAAKTGKVDALKAHLANGQDIDAKHNDNVHALGLAALFGQTEALNFLIEKGAKLDVQTKDGGTALHGSSFLGRTEIVSSLLKGGADANIKNAQGITPLDECSASWGASIEEKVDFLNDAIGVGCKAEAVREGRTKVLALLKSHSAKPGAELN